MSEAPGRRARPAATGRRVTRRPAGLVAGSLLAGSLLVGPLLAGCTAASKHTGTGPSAVKAVGGGGSLLQLKAVSESSSKVRPDDLCLPSSPAVLGTTVLDCQLTPLVNPQTAHCDVEGRTVAGRRCTPPDPQLLDEVLGWVVTSSGAGQRTLAVYSGKASPAAGATIGTPSSPTLERRYVAVDTGSNWSELAVCPGDVDGDGLMDLVVVVRNASPAAQADPEVVIVSVAAAKPTKQAMPPLQAVTARDPMPRTAGAGCASPLAHLSVVDGEVSLVAVAASPTTR